ncbi:MAG: ATP-binding protein, partial [Prochlorothrix sp.]
VQHLNVALEQKVEERTAQLQQAIEWEAMLKRITDRVRDSLDENQILQQAVKELATVLKVGSCNAALYDLDQQTSTIYYEFVTTLPASRGRVAQMSDYPEIYKQLLQEQHFQFCSVTPNPMRGPVVMLACPMFDDGGVLGDLWLVKEADYAFTDVEIRFVQQAANQCAIALRQAKLYQAAQDQVAKLEEINRLKDDFLSTVSHELRTPMTNMKMAIKMLDLSSAQQRQTLAPLLPEADPRLVQLHTKIDHYRSILSQECDREIQLINDLLDLQRLEADVQAVDLQPLDPQIWLPEQVQGFYDRAQERQQRLQIQLASDLPLLHTDPNSLDRVVAELLNNACKYTPPGEAITVQADCLPSQHLQLQVTNTGVEISPTEQRRIFDKFYRIASNDPWKQGGTGLGLALVQQLAQRLGGEITVQSGEGKTCFCLTIPLTLAEAPAAHYPLPSHDASPANPDSSLKDTQAP